MTHGYPPTAQTTQPMAVAHQHPNHVPPTIHPSNEHLPLLNRAWRGSLVLPTIATTTPTHTTMTTTVATVSRLRSQTQDSHFLNYKSCLLLSTRYESSL